MWPILGLSCMGVLGALAMGVLAFCRMRVPMIAWLLLPGTVLLTGLLGTVHGLGLAASAVVHATAEMQVAMSHAGMSMAMVTEIAGAFMAAVLLCLSGWCAAMAAVPRGGDEDPVSVAGAAVPSGLILLGALIMGAWALTRPLGGRGLMLMSLVLPGAFSLALVCLRKGSDDVHRARLAEARLTVALCVLGSVAAGAIALTRLAQSEIHGVYMAASAATLQDMMIDLTMAQDLGTELVGVSILVATIVGMGAVVPVVGRLWNGRILLSLFAVLLGCASWFGLSLKAGVTIDALSALTAPAHLEARSTPSP